MLAGAISSSKWPRRETPARNLCEVRRGDKLNYSTSPTGYAVFSSVLDHRTANRARHVAGVSTRPPSVAIGLLRIVETRDVQRRGTYQPEPVQPAIVHTSG
jgi:hypothetical protein